MNKLYFLIFFGIGLSLSLTSQSDISCGTDMAALEKLMSSKPKKNLDNLCQPGDITFLRVNYHIIYKETGNPGNFTECKSTFPFWSPATPINGYEYTEKLTANANDHWNKSYHLTIHSGTSAGEPPLPSVPKRIQLVNMGTYFHPVSSQYFYNAYINQGFPDDNSPVVLTEEVLDQFGENVGSEINIFIMDAIYSDQSIGEVISDNQGQAMVIGNGYNKYIANFGSYPQARVINHEICHMLGLDHTFQDGNDCSDLDTSLESPPGEPGKPCWNCGSNNVMAYTKVANTLSPCQIDIMHSNMSNLYDYIEGCCGSYKIEEDISYTAHHNFVDQLIPDSDIQIGCSYYPSSWDCPGSTVVPGIKVEPECSIEAEPFCPYSCDDDGTVIHNNYEFVHLDGSTGSVYHMCEPVLVDLSLSLPNFDTYYFTLYEYIAGDEYFLEWGPGTPSFPPNNPLNISDMFNTVLQANTQYRLQLRTGCNGEYTEKIWHDFSIVEAEFDYHFEDENGVTTSTFMECENIFIDIEQNYGPALEYRYTLRNQATGFEWWIDWTNGPFTEPINFSDDMSGLPLLDANDVELDDFDFVVGDTYELTLFVNYEHCSEISAVQTFTITERQLDYHFEDENMVTTDNFDICEDIFVDVTGNFDGALGYRYSLFNTTTGNDFEWWINTINGPLDQPINISDQISELPLFAGNGTAVNNFIFEEGNTYNLLFHVVFDNCKISVMHEFSYNATAADYQFVDANLEATENFSICEDIFIQPTGNFPNATGYSYSLDNLTTDEFEWYTHEEDGPLNQPINFSEDVSTYADNLELLDADSDAVTDFSFQAGHSYRLRFRYYFENCKRITVIHEFSYNESEADYQFVNANLEATENFRICEDIFIQPTGNFPNATGYSYSLDNLTTDEFEWYTHEEDGSLEQPINFSEDVSTYADNLELLDADSDAVTDFSFQAGHSYRLRFRYYFENCKRITVIHEFTVWPGEDTDQIGGQIINHCSNWGINDVFVDVTVANFNCQTVADNNGDYSCDLPSTGSGKLTPSKDGPITCALSVMDLVILKQIGAGILEPTPFQLIAGNVVATDQSLTVEDCDALRDVLLLITDEFPVGLVWDFVLEGSLVFDPELIVPYFENFFEFDVGCEPLDNVNFVALKYGDLNCNSEICEDEIVLASLNEAIDLSVSVENNTLHLKANKVESGTRGLQFAISYPSKAYEITTVSSDVLPGFGSDNFVRDQINGEIRIVWANSAGLPLDRINEGTLLSIEVQPRNTTTIQTKDFVIAPARLRSEYVDSRMNLHDITLSYGKENSAVDKEMEIFPNPFSNQISVVNKYQTTLNVDILDLNGLSVKQLKVDSLSTRTIDLSGLDEGLYIVSYRNPLTNEFKSETIVKALSNSSYK